MRPVSSLFRVLWVAFAAWVGAFSVAVPTKAAQPSATAPVLSESVLAVSPLGAAKALSSPATPPLDPAVTLPAAAKSAPAKVVTSPADMTMAGFLDRLMRAESGGRLDARNPRSTAVGPYQFIEGTWLDLAHRHFAAETQALTQPQILAMRTDLAVARRGAEIYVKESAAVLKAVGVEPTFPHLRLAFLLGPHGAIRVLQAAPQTRVTLLLGPAVAAANPFMFGLTAEALIARAARDLSVAPRSLAGLAAGDIPSLASLGAGGAKAVGPRPPRVAVRCNLDLPACRRWQSLALARVAKAAPRNKLARR